jgi:hypothetical protein
MVISSVLDHGFLSRRSSHTTSQLVALLQIGVRRDDRDVTCFASDSI